MARTAIHTATKLVEEPWFIEGRQILTRDGVQVATILSTPAPTVRIERRTDEDPEAWEIAFDEGRFGSLQVLADGGVTGSMPAGILEADPDDDPPPGRGYMMLVICRITFTVAYGGHTCGKVFRRPWKIPASALTAPDA